MATVPAPDDLAGLTLFRDLTPAELAQIHRQLRATTFAPDATIMTTEQPGEAVYIVLEGTLKTFVEQAGGTNVILAILGPGEIVGEMSMFDQQTRSASVVTMEEATLLWLDRASFWACLRTIPQLSINLVTIVARRLRMANDHIQALATLNVDGRVARQLLAFARVYGRPAPGGLMIPLRLTQSDLAEVVGASRVRVNQVLVALRERRLISIDQRARITIHDEAALAERCS
jgi:CRP/FNR family transcriptional regulator, cyclic AMP receptor protein